MDGNRLLAGLPREEWSSLHPHMTRLKLAHGVLLCRLGVQARSAFLPESGLVSLLMPSTDGGTVQVAAVGAGGLVTPTMFSEPYSRYEAIVAVPSDMLRIDVDRLRRACDRSPVLSRALFEQTQALLVQVSHAAACHHFHTVDQRLARLLLSLRDAASADALEITHDFLARLLGNPRSVVSMAIGELDRSGVIRSRRGRITLIRRAALEQHACACYRALKDQASTHPDHEMRCV